MRAARDAVAVGKLSGAVGTYSNIDPEVEVRVCAALGLTPVPATQVIARDRHAEYFYACAAVGRRSSSCAPRSGTWPAASWARWRSPSAPGRRAARAMPHKRNPILSERLCGLARLLRGYLGAGLEDVALWHERDISHSSVERVALPDASLLACYVLRKATALASGLVVHPERALANLTEGTLGLVFSQSVLLALVSAGLTARRGLPHRAARRARGLVGAAPAPRRPRGRPGGAAGQEQLDGAFDLSRTLRHVDRFAEALAAL